MNIEPPKPGPLRLPAFISVISVLASCSGSDSSSPLATPSADAVTPAIPTANLEETLVSTSPQSPISSAPVELPVAPIDPALSCSGVRVWTVGAGGGFLPNSDFFISEGSGFLASPPSGEVPCSIIWQFDASANCSLAFSFENALNRFGLDFETASATVTTQSNLSVTINGEVLQEELPLSGISFEQLFNIPDCPLPTGAVP